MRHRFGGQHVAIEALRRQTGSGFGLCRPCILFPQRPAKGICDALDGGFTAEAGAVFLHQGRKAGACSDNAGQAIAQRFQDAHGHPLGAGGLDEIISLQQQFPLFFPHNGVMDADQVIDPQLRAAPAQKRVGIFAVGAVNIQPAVALPQKLRIFCQCIQQNVQTLDGDLQPADVQQPAAIGVFVGIGPGISTPLPDTKPGQRKTLRLCSLSERYWIALAFFRKGPNSSTLATAFFSHFRFCACPVRQPWGTTI